MSLSLLRTAALLVGSALPATTASAAPPVPPAPNPPVPSGSAGAVDADSYQAPPTDAGETTSQGVKNFIGTSARRTPGSETLGGTELSKPFSRLPASVDQAVKASTVGRLVWFSPEQVGGTGAYGVLQKEDDQKAMTFFDAAGKPLTTAVVFPRNIGFHGVELPMAPTPPPTPTPAASNTPAPALPTAKGLGWGAKVALTPSDVDSYSSQWVQQAQTLAGKLKALPADSDARPTVLQRQTALGDAIDKFVQNCGSGRYVLPDGVKPLDVVQAPIRQLLTTAEKPSVYNIDVPEGEGGHRYALSLTPLDPAKYPHSHYQTANGLYVDDNLMR